MPNKRGVQISMQINEHVVGEHLRKNNMRTAHLFGTRVDEYEIIVDLLHNRLETLHQYISIIYSVSL